MHVLRRTTIPQRVVLVVALGLVLLSGWLWWYSGEVGDPVGGWFAYGPEPAPDTDWYVVESRRVEHLAVPVALVVLWAAISVWLLGLHPVPRSEKGAPS